MFEIRAAKIEDKESIRQIYRSTAGSESQTDESYWDHLIREGAVLVAQLESRIIGFGGIDLQASEQVKWLYLLPEHQGTGVGSAILHQLERIGVSAGLESLRLHSSPGAVKFYLRHGYREVDPAHRIGHDHAGVEMVKDLGAS